MSDIGRGASSERGRGGGATLLSLDPEEPAMKLHQEYLRSTLGYTHQVSCVFVLFSRFALRTSLTKVQA